MKRNKIIISIFIIILIVLISNTVFGLDNIFRYGEEWTNKTTDKGREAYESGNQIAGILWIIGLFAFVIVGIVTGIRYMFAAGTESKAEIKKSMTPYLLGGVIVFGALTIWRFLINFLDGI